MPKGWYCDKCQTEVQPIRVNENELGVWWTCDSCKSTGLVSKSRNKDKYPARRKAILSLVK